MEFDPATCQAGEGPGGSRACVAPADRAEDGSFRASYAMTMMAAVPVRTSTPLEYAITKPMRERFPELRRETSPGCRSALKVAIGCARRCNRSRRRSALGADERWQQKRECSELQEIAIASHTSPEFPACIGQSSALRLLRFQAAIGNNTAFSPAETALSATVLTCLGNKNRNKSRERASGRLPNQYLPCIVFNSVRRCATRIGTWAHR